MQTETPERAMPDELTKSEYSCIDKIKPDEPIFVLRGQDKLAHFVVDYWAKVAEVNGVDAEKVAGAREIAQDMRNHKPQKLPD